VALYLDTSAAVKLVQEEDGSLALHSWLLGQPGSVLASSLLLHTELLRATRRGRPDLLAQARDLLAHVVLIDLGWEVCERAAMLDPAGMRSLDALHLASALTLAEDLEGIVTYDTRLADAALTLGLQVHAPVLDAG
jgi:predicted nucleic acid-binding protein